jgi:GAF domain-containing protein
LTIIRPIRTAEALGRGTGGQPFLPGCPERTLALSSDDVFSSLHKAAQDGAGVRLFTISLVDRQAGLSRRAYTSHPDVYPVTGTKPLEMDDWARHVIDGKKTFVANTTAEFASLFFDHALINALGCQSAVNIPVIDGDEAIGTVNLLDVEGHFTPERLAQLEELVSRQSQQLVAALRGAKL